MRIARPHARSRGRRAQRSKPPDGPHAHHQRCPMRQRSSRVQARQRASPGAERCARPTPPRADEGEAHCPIWPSQHGCADHIRPAPAASGEHLAPPCPGCARRCARHRARGLSAPTTPMRCAPPAGHMRSHVYRSLRLWDLRRPKSTPRASTERAEQRRRMHTRRIRSTCECAGRPRHPPHRCAAFARRVRPAPAFETGLVRCAQWAPSSCRWNLRPHQ